VTDPLDPRMDDYRALRDSDLRGRGIFVVESRLAVRRLLQSARFSARSVLTTEATLEGLRDLLEGPAAAVPVLVASHETIRQIAGFMFHRGCLAVGERPARTAPATLIDLPGPRTLAVIEALADPENIGAVFRNAMAFGAHGILLSPDCGDPLGRKAIRVSSGGTLRMPFAELDGWPGDLAWLRAAGYDVLALSPDGVVDLLDLGSSHPIRDRLAIVMGNEGGGLSDGARREATLTVRIAMAEGVDSINVATASGIALHHVRERGRRGDGTGSP
jgi:tRNA G18 (ribose-2'-O)-methylase SpoU